MAEEPSVGRGLTRVMGLVFILASVGLVVTGLAVRPGDEAVMEGGERLLFEVIPMTPFALAMSVIFLALGLWLTRASFR